jgi:hypothetical protein
MTTKYYFPIEAILPENETIKKLNETLQQFGIGKRLSITGNIGGTTVTVTGDRELDKTALFLMQQTLQKALDDINTSNIKLVVQEGRKT